MSNKLSIAVFAGGCFWCTEAIFKRIKGVVSVTSGYTGGFIKNPAYREVCQGTTGHAEGVRIEFEPVQVTYNDLLEVFFATHDPTTLNRQGNDVGTQYRSEIFYTSESQKEQAESFVNHLNDNRLFGKPIVTKVSAFEVFYDAEKNHHDYYDLNKTQPYCQVIIYPKLEKLKQLFNDQLKP